jgi:hypothetical protein
VLLVWHAHMLNPRVYLEDCIRFGLKSLWNGGMPWRVVNEAIDTNFNYRVPDETIRSWERLTGTRFENTQGSLIKDLHCPCCDQDLPVPWTTCGLPEDSKQPSPGLVGTGYGDGEFSYVCHACGTTVDRRLLEVASMVTDVKKLLSRSQPMPGTILDILTGMPEIPQVKEANKWTYERGFPNRLILTHLRSKILDLLQPGRMPQASMEDIRKMIEDAIANTAVVAEANKADRYKINHYGLPTRSKVHLRKMMSRYWSNPSIFSLELGGCVLRQGTFSEKMHKVRKAIFSSRGASD